MAKLKVTYNAPTVLTFSLLAALIYVLADYVDADVMRYFVIGPELDEPLDYFRLVSHSLGHASWPHLVGNLSLILLLGPILEERHGSGSLAIMIVITALVTGIINVALVNQGLLGASGIVFMFILLASTANIRQGEIPLTFILVAVLFLGQEAVNAFHDDCISQMAHLVGGVAGAAFGFLHASLSKSRASAPRTGIGL